MSALVRLERAALRLALLTLLGLLACGEPDPAQTFLWIETFETVCDGDLPCGWDRVDGSGTDARYVMSTLLSGEHGIVLSDGAEVRGPGAAPDTATFMFGALEAHFSGRCDPGAGLEVVVGLAETDLRGRPTGRVDVTMRDEVYLPADYTTAPAEALLVAEGYFNDAGISMGTYTGQLQITSVLLRHIGSGSCELIEMSIDDPGMAARVAPEGC